MTEQKFCRFYGEEVCQSCADEHDQDEQREFDEQRERDLEN